MALPKGRLGDKVYDLLARIGYGCPEDYNATRKQIQQRELLMIIREKPALMIFWQHLMMMTMMSMMILFYIIHLIIVMQMWYRSSEYMAPIWFRILEKFVIKTGMP